MCLTEFYPDIELLVAILADQSDCQPAIPERSVSNPHMVCFLVMAWWHTQVVWTPWESSQKKRVKPGGRSVSLHETVNPDILVTDDNLLLGALNEHDVNDPTSIPSDYRPKALSRDKISRLRIGVPVECFPAETNEESIRPLRQALATLREQVEVEVVSISIPSTTKALSAYYTIASAEASSNLARYDGIRYGFRSEGHIEETRTAGFGTEVQKRIILGTYALTAE